MGSDLNTLRHRFDVPARVKDSILSKPLAWFGGSLGAGLLTSMLVRRPRKREEKVRRAWWSLALSGAIALARPTLQTWALRALQSRFIPHDSTVNRPS
ncbi:hypothetical protein [Luteolibacter marinus]|uniref:hypothetical protein n=1 Tax=Luteolibacter marinus TaxID=2776705 RepID=UPI001867FAF3|nr:hypothetical protein [Luteolibacter marinus]